MGVLYKDLYRMLATTSSEQDTLDISRFVSNAGGGEGNTIRVEALIFLLLALLLTNRDLLKGHAIDFRHFLGRSEGGF